MGVYVTWAINTVMSNRVYLNLTLAAHAHGRGIDGVTTTTTGLSSTRVEWANHPDGTEMELERTETFGAKRKKRRTPTTTFSTVSLGYLFSLPSPPLPSLPCSVSYRRLPLHPPSPDGSQRGTRCPARSQTGLCGVKGVKAP
jgi:hypothetical protein